MRVLTKLVWHVWQEPTNDVYKKALDMTAQAPQLHAELQKQIAGSQVRDMNPFNSLQMQTSTTSLQSEVRSLRTQLVLWILTLSDSLQTSGW